MGIYGAIKCSGKPTDKISGTAIMILQPIKLYQNIFSLEGVTERVSQHSEHMASLNASHPSTAWDLLDSMPALI